MPHQSENTTRLEVHSLAVSTLKDIPSPDRREPSVWLFVLPQRPVGRVGDILREVGDGLHERSVVAVLTSPEVAADVVAGTTGILHFQLWIAVKLAQPLARPGQLPSHHATLLVLSRYRQPLRHAKTRIAYTYCPACERTTKDYGGKKHTYHAYGTLMSDVWRDIAYAPGEPPKEIVERLADLFGVQPYKHLRVIDLSDVRPASISQSSRPGRPATSSRTTFATLPSKLRSGDALAELQKLPADSVDFAFADPPYNLAKRYDALDDDIAVGDYLDWCARWIEQLARVLRPGCTCAVLNIPLWSVRHFHQLRQSGLQFQHWIAWEGLSVPVRMVMPAHYAIVCFSKGAPRPLPGLRLTGLRENFCLRPTCAKRRAGDRQPITDLWWDVHRLKHNARRVDHPCQLPPTLMRRLIELFTREGEIVLDPFNGAGTTTLCAAALRRRYLGIERSPRYHRLALARHELVRTKGDPFAKLAYVPAAKNSRVRRAGRAGGILRYEVPKKKLQLEVRRVAQLLGGRLPSRAELRDRGRFPIRYYDEYFASWGEVCAAARTTGMSERKIIDCPA